MSENINQFAIYSAKIFELLYDSFPIPRSLDRRSIVSEYLSFSQTDELKELKIKSDMADIFVSCGDEGLERRIKEKVPTIKSRIAELEEAQRTDMQYQQQIYDGTLGFLAYEELLRKCKSGGYQLTSKGFSHLNKKFENAEISGDSRSNIDILKTIFEKVSETSLQVAAGTAVNVITRVIGYG